MGPDEYGETDLLEGSRRTGRETVWFVGLVTGLLLTCGVLIFIPVLLSQRTQSEGETQSAETAARASTLSVTPNPLASSQPILIATNTQRPELVLSTVTPAPPTPTLSPTPGPCEVTVQAGDDLTSLAYGCGHRSLDVIPLILQLNNMDSADMLQAGQSLTIPWPTPEGGPPPEAVATSGASSGADTSVQLASAPESLVTTAPTLFPTATLLPGLMWYVVQPNDSMVGIMYQYNTSAEVLSQINPEIPFSQCDFSEDTGGPSCTVLLQPGQMFRVPAPTPTPTLSPTPSGSETATPTATATFNAPALMSPNNRSLFGVADIITLRWVTSGVLGIGESYQITVRDLTSGVEYRELTTEQFFIIPEAWQGTDDRRHDFEWTVGVVTESNPNNVLYPTEPRLFTWESRGGAP
ncbi:MAG: LysM peptidoglycan-binding domain-containing protein [Pleurocapsa minor GSE-CHR-MK-17-07R]|jgi:LysM repeat protein|nr:LysM peptidoglycan-binding domain-containing protein [Pleurocapsa minor GSE-CHR-MK 17-07R]